MVTVLKYIGNMWGNIKRAVKSVPRVLHSGPKDAYLYFKTVTVYFLYVVKFHLPKFTLKSITSAVVALTFITNTRASK